MEVIETLNLYLGYLLVALLLGCAVWFTLSMRGVQFRLFGDMLRLLRRSDVGASQSRGGGVTSFQAFTVSIASRVGTGNLAGVATAIALGGAGAIFWMWVVALLGVVNAFVESSLAQLFKSRSASGGGFVGGPAYYISKGLGSRWFAALFALTIIFTFPYAVTSVQSNTIGLAFETAFGVAPIYTGCVIAVATMFVIFGGVRRIAHFTQYVVPVMSLFYIVLALIVVALNFRQIPHVFYMIFADAFGGRQLMGGLVGSAIMMGIKRGLFSNEAGMGSAPNVAATADVSHPIKQGLVQSLGVYVDTLVICTSTAFIILCGGLYDSGLTGIELTQMSLMRHVGEWGSYFVAVVILFFAFTSIVANYYYGESNLRFLTANRFVLFVFRLAVVAMVMYGAVAQLDVVWGLSDIGISLMTLCNLTALVLLRRYAIRLLNDYELQRALGLRERYYATTIPEIYSKTECWH
ncbi:MAG: alanine/glycine:cation symporter family protein [Rikenellaceae bacterium]